MVTMTPMTLNELHSEYETVQKELLEAEARADELRKQKANVAQRILTEFGPGPHELGGKRLLASKGKNGTTFLREAPPPKAKKS